MAAAIEDVESLFTDVGQVQRELEKLDVERAIDANEIYELLEANSFRADRVQFVTSHLLFTLGLKDDLYNDDVEDGIIEILDEDVINIVSDDHVYTLSPEYELPSELPQINETVELDLTVPISPIDSVAVNSRENANISIADCTISSEPEVGASTSRNISEPNLIQVHATDSCEETEAAVAAILDNSESGIDTTSNDTNKLQGVEESNYPAYQNDFLYDVNNNDPNNNTEYEVPLEVENKEEDLKFAVEEPEESDLEFQDQDDIRSKLLEEARLIHRIVPKQNLEQIYSYLEANLDSKNRLQIVMQEFLKMELSTEVCTVPDENLKETNCLNKEVTDQISHENTSSAISNSILEMDSLEANAEPLPGTSFGEESKLDPSASSNSNVNTYDMQPNSSFKSQSTATCDTINLVGSDSCDAAYQNVQDSNLVNRVNGISNQVSSTSLELEEPIDIHNVLDLSSTGATGKLLLDVCPAPPKGSHIDILSPLGNTHKKCKKPSKKRYSTRTCRNSVFQNVNPDTNELPGTSHTHVLHKEFRTMHEQAKESSEGNPRTLLKRNKAIASTAALLVNDKKKKKVIWNTPVAAHLVNDEINNKNKTVTWNSPVDTHLVNDEINNKKKNVTWNHLVATHVYYQDTPVAMPEDLKENLNASCFREEKKRKSDSVIDYSPDKKNKIGEPYNNIPKSELTVDQLKFKSTLLEMFPDADPVFLQEECRHLQSEIAFNDLITLMLQKPYPVRELPIRIPSEPVLDPQPGPSGVTPDLAEQIDAQLKILLAILPKADPSYLREKCENLIGKENEMKAFVSDALENSQYPTREEYLKRQEALALQKKYTEQFSIEGFLEILPDPFKYFDEEKKNDLTMFSYAMPYLKSRYRRILQSDICSELRRNGYNLTKTCEALDKFVGTSRKSKRGEYECRIPEKVNIPFLQEVAFIENKEKIRDYLLEKQIQKNKKFEEAKANGDLLVCGCCFDNEVLLDDIAACNEGHLFCKECIRKFAEIKIGDGVTAFPCLSDCGSEFSLKTLQSVLKPAIFSKMLQRKQLEEIKAAGIDDLETCPFCDFASIPPREDKVFRCLNPDCMRESCRLCKEPNHVPLRCDEVEKADEVRARTYIEDRMTEALVRTCWKCNKKFIKEDGCNKMTCTCGAMMCYICRQPVKDYSHFNGQGGDQYHKCPLYSNNDVIHVNPVIEEAEKAKQEVRAMNPQLNLKHDPTANLPQAGQARRIVRLVQPCAYHQVFIQRHGFPYVNHVRPNVVHNNVRMDVQVVAGPVNIQPIRRVPGAALMINGPPPPGFVPQRPPPIQYGPPPARVPRELIQHIADFVQQELRDRRMNAQGPNQAIFNELAQEQPVIQQQEPLPPNAPPLEIHENL